MNQHPTHGARVRFDLRREDDELAHYDVTVFDCGGSYVFVAVLSATTGEVRLEQAPEDAPAWAAGSVLPFAKQILSARRAAPAARWPRRVLRWRAGGSR